MFSAFNSGEAKRKNNKKELDGEKEFWVKAVCPIYRKESDSLLQSTDVCL